MEVNVSPLLIERLTTLSKDQDIRSFSSMLRSMVLRDVQAQVRGGFPVGYQEFLQQMDEFFALLDLITEETEVHV